MKTINNNFEELASCGTVNTENQVVTTPHSNKIGVAVMQPSAKKAIVVDIIVPEARSSCGSRRVSHLTLNGYQARALLNSLNEAYSNGTINND